MNATRKVKLKDIKANLSCKLCLGYLVDATTIIECLHSFCKSCIIAYLEKSDRDEKYCPVCDVQLHSTKPLTSIRSDLMLQEIVYKLVPGLFKSEMRRRREFYTNNSDATPANPLDSGQVFDELYITSDDPMDLSLEYVTDDEKLRDSTKRYLRCPAAVSIFVLKKLLHSKYDLDVDTNIDIMFGERILPDDFLLMDVAYKYSWTKNGNKPLSLRYRIRGHSKPVMKPDKTINESTPTPQPVKTLVSEESQTPQTNKKRVCNENGSNIMPPEDIRPSIVKMPPNGLITEELATVPIKTPNGKIKARKRKNSNYSDIVIESREDIKNLTKKLKIEKSSIKNPLKRTPSEPSFNAQTTQMEITPIPKSTNSTESSKDLKEVQLHISENGVVSVQSVSSNKDDKIVFDLGKRVSSAPTPIVASNSNTSPNLSQDVCPTEKLLLSGNFYSKTGPSGVTEIICNKPDPSATCMKTSSAKPGYVTLNIPTPKIPVSCQNGRIQKNSMLNGASEGTEKRKLPQNDSGGKASDRGFSNKSSILEKIKNRITANVADASTTTSRPISELIKLSNNSDTNTNSGTSFDQNRTAGKHSLPIVAPLSSPVQQQHEKVKATNGSGKGMGNDIIYPLNLSPKLGMSMSVIPNIIPAATATNTSTATNSSTSNFSSSSSSTTALKRGTYIPNPLGNGIVKFSKTLKPILPKLSKDHEAEVSPKKPPKFFKSRRMSSPGTSPSTSQKNAKYSTTTASPKQDSNELKRKSPSAPLLNGKGTKGATETSQKKPVKDRKEQATNPINPIDLLKLFSSGIMAAGVHSNGNMTEKQTGSNSGSNDTSSNGLHGSRGSPYQPQGTDILSHHLLALNNYAAANNPLNSGLGIAQAAAVASAAANGNGLPVGMMPFITENYCSLPFLNQRHAIPNFPFGYTTQVGGFQTPVTNLTTATTTPVNSAKTKSPVSGNNVGGLNGLLLNGPSETTNDSGSTLDLSMSKNISPQSTVSSSTEKVKESNPLLVSLLNSNSMKSPEAKAKNTKTTPPRSIDHTNNNSKLEKPKSPIIRHLLEKREEKNKARAMSPQGTKKRPGDTFDRDFRKSPTINGNGICNGSKVTEQANENGTKSGSPIGKASSNSNDLTEPKSSVPTNSPKINNDSDSNISSSIGSPKIILEKEKLMCLSAQNNNIETMSSSHDKSHDSITTNGTNDNFDCTSATK